MINHEAIQDHFRYFMNETLRPQSPFLIPQCSVLASCALRTQNEHTNTSTNGHKTWRLYHSDSWYLRVRLNPD